MKVLIKWRLGTVNNNGKEVVTVIIKRVEDKHIHNNKKKIMKSHK